MKKPTSKLIASTQAAALARNRQRLGELVSLMRRRMTEVVEGFYDIGEALQEVLAKKLYAAQGHASMEDFLKSEGLMSFRQASKLMAVVRRVPREQALELGQERAYALIAYTDATPEPDSPASLLAKGAAVGASPVAKASVRAIHEATRAAREEARAQRPPSESERARIRADKALAKTVRAAMRAAGLGRVEIVIDRAEVQVRFSRAQAERLTDAE